MSFLKDIGRSHPGFELPWWVYVDFVSSDVQNSKHRFVCFCFFGPHRKVEISERSRVLANELNLQSTPIDTALKSYYDRPRGFFL